MIVSTVKHDRKTMQACDECGACPKKLIEIKLDRTPARVKLCRKCAKKVVSEIENHLYGRAARSRKLDCFVPEQDAVYPLCVGNGSEQCKQCNLYRDMEDEGGYSYE